MVELGTILRDRYRLVRPLGGGGMKMVYLAEDLHLSRRRCALAVVAESALIDQQQRRMAVAAFEREATTLSELRNPHIPHIYDYFSEGDRHYLVMEYFEGATLEEVLREAGGQLPAKPVVSIAHEILDTLEYLHSLNPPIIYRDLKPSNVVITPENEVKLIDFGLARHFAPQTAATLVGTPGYAPPEQYRGQVDVRSDLYALGAVMYQALSGWDPASNPPFSFRPLNEIEKSVNPALAELVDAALQYDSEKRVPSAREFSRRLLLSDPDASGSDPRSSKRQTVRQQSCKSCGTAISEDDSFCTSCGTPLNSTSSTPSRFNDKRNGPPTGFRQAPVRPYLSQNRPRRAIRWPTWRRFVRACAVLCFVGAALTSIAAATNHDESLIGAVLWLVMQGSLLLWLPRRRLRRTVRVRGARIMIVACMLLLSFCILGFAVTVVPFSAGTLGYAILALFPGFGLLGLTQAAAKPVSQVATVNLEKSSQPSIPS